MKIHSSVKFSEKKIAHHFTFDVDIPNSQLAANKNKIANLAIQNLKVKCKENFFVDFSTLVFFEVYFFHKEKEYQIFKKEKTI